jgi:glutaredoxin-related protein
MSGYEKALDLWKSYTIISAADLDRVLHHYRILFAYNSGKIENEVITYHDTREIFENGKVAGFSGDPRALFEQQNQLLCYELLKEKIMSAFKNTTRMRRLHRLKHFLSMRQKKLGRTK